MMVAAFSAGFGREATISRLWCWSHVKVEYVDQQLEQGMRVESEHTRIKAAAREIALDHLNERPDYYVRLKKVER